MNARRTTHDAHRTLLPTVYFLAGPTAVGKTELALKIALRMGAEIISADSMQVYKGADIISAKPSSLERARVKHHLLDTLSPDKEWSAADFRKQALEAIRSILSRGAHPLVVGGSGLYLRTLIKGIFEGPPRDRMARQKLDILAEDAEGVSVLWERLSRVDPLAAERIGPKDRRRLIRALEVYEQSGTPLSGLQALRTPLESTYRVCFAGLVRPRKELYERSDKRVDEMFAHGLIDEVRNLLARGTGFTLEQCIGFREVVSFLTGTSDVEEAKDNMKRSTRRLVKKQLTWFRREEGFKWFSIGSRLSEEFPGKAQRLCPTDQDAECAILRYWGLSK